MLLETFQAQTRPSRRPRFHTLTGVQILGTGAFAPEQVIRNQDLAVLGYDAEWIIQRTGIAERRHVTDRQATSDLAFEAALRCLASSSGAEMMEMPT